LEKELILNILLQVLGKSKKTSRNNYAFKCPNNCHPTKHKLEINLDTHQYQCWICGNQEGGYKGKNLIKLLKQSKASPTKIDELKPYIKYKSKPNSLNVPSTNLILPKEFKPFFNNPHYNKQALKYLKSRGLTNQDIIKYNIGYCDEGEYRDKIIIPSYDKEGKLNFFTSRSFIKDSFIKYKNPDISRNIVPFELFINWNLPIILCEGVFDAIAIKRNAIPLLGKTLSQELLKNIITNNSKKIYIALDNDALEDALKHCELFLNENKEVHLVKLDQKDPSEIGFNKFLELLETSIPLTFNKLLKYKLYL